jgi:hypothetical protein
MPNPMSTPAAFRVAAAGTLVALAGCNGINIQPDTTLPKALVVPIPAKVGLLIGSELSNYKHEETRAATNWKIDLGAGDVHLFRDVMKASFTDVTEFKDRDSAVAAPGLQALFDPRIEQYSFATANDTAGGYWAVTIRYRINVLAPGGEEADSLTLTGYGSTLPERGAAKSLQRATIHAMRDAAAKFLVQFPRQKIAARLREGRPLEGAPAGPVVVDDIETVPIEEPPLALAR